MAWTEIKETECCEYCLNDADWMCDSCLSSTCNRCTVLEGYDTVLCRGCSKKGEYENVRNRIGD